MREGSRCGERRVSDKALEWPGEGTTETWGWRYRWGGDQACSGRRVAQGTFTPAVLLGDASGNPTTCLGVGNGCPSAGRSPPQATHHRGAALGCHSAGEPQCPHLWSKPKAGLQVTGLLSAWGNTTLSPPLLVVMNHGRAVIFH